MTKVYPFHRKTKYRKTERKRPLERQPNEKVQFLQHCCIKLYFVTIDEKMNVSLLALQAYDMYSAFITNDVFLPLKTEMRRYHNKTNRRCTIDCIRQILYKNHPFSDRDSGRKSNFLDLQYLYLRIQKNWAFRQMSSLNKNFNFCFHTLGFIITCRIVISEIWIRSRGD